jgi:undecaprenyl-diphosphatase
MDETIMGLVHSVDALPVRAAMTVITQFGSHALIGTAAGLTALALKRRGQTDDAWTVVLNSAGAMALNTSLKAVFQRQRPQERARHIRLPRSHSFPSGHSLLSAATYPIVAQHLVQMRSTRLLLLAQGGAVLIILLVGFSRVYFGVHFPSDVLGGYAAGLGWLGLSSLTHALIDGTGDRK